jgi:hypothetical protein
MRAKEKEAVTEGDRKPNLIEIRDQWFKDVPDIEAAYWLKEDFSDILQLRDRQKAEGLTDLWLQRVKEFVGDFAGKYDKEIGRSGRPFCNVLTTINRWRPHILNYIDCKNRFAPSATNYFAEHVNKKIKRAKALGNGSSFETLRMKVIHGGVMVKRRPPHPLSEKRPRPGRRHAGRSRKGDGGPNPDSNLEQLRKAREDRDETKDLIPKPRENSGWACRFGSLPQAAPVLDSRQPDAGGEAAGQRQAAELKPQTSAARGRARRRRQNPDQLEMF